MTDDTPRTGAVTALAALLRETEGRHARFEASHAAHEWTDWYAAYIDARQRGGDPDAADATATRFMEEVHGIARR